MSSNLDAKFHGVFVSALKVYWDVLHSPFHQSRGLLQTLRSVFGARLYVTTEGHHETQVAKIRVLHLDDIFTEGGVMSTGAAANPHEHLRVIEDNARACETLIREGGLKLQGATAGVNAFLAIFHKDTYDLDHGLDHQGRQVVDSAINVVVDEWKEIFRKPQQDSLSMVEKQQSHLAAR